MKGLAQPAPPSRLARLVLFACIAVGAAIRFTGLEKESLWIDEGWVLDVIQRPTLWDAIRAASETVHPPLHAVLLRGWVWLFGESDAALRSLSALVSTLAIPASWALARRLVAPRAALAATAIVALSTLLVRHAHDAKQYSLLLLLATLSTERFLAFAQGRSKAPLVGWTVVTVLLLYTHFLGAAVVLAQDALVFLGVPRAARSRRELLRPLLVGHVVVVAAVAPWAPFLFGSMPTFRGFPGSESPRALWRAFETIAGTARGTAILFGLAGLALLLRRRRGRAAPRGLRAGLLLATVPLVGPWIVSALTFPSFATRLAIPAVPPLAAAAGAGLVRLVRPARRGLFVALAVCVVALGLAWLHPRVGREQWREAAAYVASQAEPGDAVLAIWIPDAILLRRYLGPGGPPVLEARDGHPTAVPGGGRLFVVPSVHTRSVDSLRCSLASRGWHESAEKPFVMVRVLVFDP
jgi:4-amino-4-deoxy-L-arabinose transferase-like glycosyltransferase